MQMTNRYITTLITLIVIQVMLIDYTAAYAGSSSTGQVPVPEVSALILAPSGLAAVIALNRRRRNYDRIHESIGFGHQLTKRTVDVLFSFSLLLIAAPLFGLIALLVRLDSVGPIIFRRMVVGKDGKRFAMLKFRTMVPDAEYILAQSEELKKLYYPNCKIENDPRVTRIGRFLRKTSLDELPQVVNVLRGEMTFVGPRPIADDEVDLYGPSVERFKTVTPGITGLWQTSGRSETSYQRRVELDMFYIENRSLFLDIRILLGTVTAVLLKKGAF
jgi:lipopolysaccharide/colanic/teichoic acid biosynthesis glycosyltransferase